MFKYLISTTNFYQFFLGTLWQQYPLKQSPVCWLTICLYWQDLSSFSNHNWYTDLYLFSPKIVETSEPPIPLFYRLTILDGTCLMLKCSILQTSYSSKYFSPSPTNFIDVIFSSPISKIKSTISC